MSLRWRRARVTAESARVLARVRQEVVRVEEEGLRLAEELSEDRPSASGVGDAGASGGRAGGGAARP